MARALAELGHEVVVLKAVRDGEPILVEKLAENCVLKDIKTRMLGNNGIFEAEYVRELEAFKPDALVMFADLQLCTPAVARWCRRNSVLFIPYVGSIVSKRRWRLALQTFSRSRNFRVFRSWPVLAKTDAIKRDLTSVGVMDVHVVSVGLDTADMPSPTVASRPDARRELGLGPGPIVGFVGRITPDKYPQSLPRILAELRSHRAWRIIIVGEGSLSSSLNQHFEQLGLRDQVLWIHSIPNREMWKIYLASDVLVNTNHGEVFGMCLLESLYFGTPVVAVSAPGPQMILRHGTDGFLSDSSPAMVAEYVEKAYDCRMEMGMFGQERISGALSWKVGAHMILEVIKEQRRRPGSG
jgi:glycosyltransferase involved in cell wall biosynthesis